MVVWFLILILTAPDGSDARAVLNTSKTPQYNTQEACVEVAKVLAEQMKQKVGDKAKVFWQCQAIEEQEFKRALPPSI